MPLQSKTRVRALVRQLIDDPAGKLWNTTNLDILAEGCLDELWSDLLDAFPYLTSNEETLTLSTTPALVSPGVITLSGLSQRFHRVQAVTRDNGNYREAHPGEVTLSQGVAIEAPDLTWAVVADSLYLFPLSTGTGVTLRYSYLPEPFTSLTPGPNPDDTNDDEISFIPWPDGHHMAYIYDIVSKALEKGDRENSDRFNKRAERSLFRLKAYLRKRGVGAIRPLQTDGLNWGGV